ncbi:MAG: AAC(3) family N-acetyltransferase [Treponema sp.]|nr:AAC(3) family N-acetyltransferase [Treponema sp.]
MSEETAIAQTEDRPNTITSLTKDFIRLGIKPGMVLIVHSSLSSLGWVCGGTVSVILALENVLTGEGTLIMPSHSGDLSDPANWSNPPVPASWIETIRNEMPAFDRDLTPTRGIGKIPETFRKQKTVVRSPHPQVSFAAWGKNREYIIQDNHFDYAMNKQSPLGRIYDLDGSILLIGVGYENNTSLHLAEYLADYPAKKIIKNGMPVSENGNVCWKEFNDVDISTDDFEKIGADYEKENVICTGKAGNAVCKLINQRSLVDFAVKWMKKNRR